MNRDFLRYQTQTTPHPLGIEISHGEGDSICSPVSPLNWVAVRQDALEGCLAWDGTLHAQSDYY